MSRYDENKYYTAGMVSDYIDKNFGISFNEKTIRNWCKKGLIEDWSQPQQGKQGSPISIRLGAVIDFLKLRKS